MLLVDLKYCTNLIYIIITSYVSFIIDNFQFVIFNILGERGACLFIN